MTRDMICALLAGDGWYPISDSSYQRTAPTSVGVIVVRPSGAWTIFAQGDGWAIADTLAPGDVGEMIDAATEMTRA